MSGCSMLWKNIVYKFKIAYNERLVRFLYFSFVTLLVAALNV